MMFLLKYDDNVRNPDLLILMKSSFLDFLKDLNPDESERDIKQVLNEITYEDENQNDFIDWEKKYVDLINKHNISLFELYGLFEKMYIVNHNLHKNIRELRKLLHYDKTL